MNIKIVFTILSTIIGIIAFFPYLKDIFSFKTKPHVYTWLIWSITQATAVLGVWYGGGGWGTLSLLVFTILSFSIFLFSIKYGTKDITKIDTIILVIALFAILVWWQLNKPIISILIITIADVLGYIPSFRKSYKDPWSETLISWAGFVLSNIFAVLALREYNLLTTIYLVIIMLSSASLFLFCFIRRRFVPKL